MPPYPSTLSSYRARRRFLLESSVSVWENRPMRVEACLLAAAYLLASASPVVGALESVAPRTKLVRVADFPCAHHGCGCETAEQCRLRCCCHPPAARQPATPPMAGWGSPRPRHRLAHEPHETVPVSALSEARCQGHRDEASPSAWKLAPHLPPGASSLRACISVRRATFAQARGVPVVFPDPPDTIPI